MNLNEPEQPALKPFESSDIEDWKVAAGRRADEMRARFNRDLAEAKRLGISLHELDERRDKEAEGK